jgi:hypothetical protein
MKKKIIDYEGAWCEMKKVYESLRYFAKLAGQNEPTTEIENLMLNLEKKHTKEMEVQ